MLGAPNGRKGTPFRIVVTFEFIEAWRAVPFAVGAADRRTEPANFEHADSRMDRVPSPNQSPGGDVPACTGAQTGLWRVEQLLDMFGQRQRGRQAG